LSESQKRQRAHGIYVACTDEERERIAAKAQAAGMSTASYLRACALGDGGPRAQRSPTIEHKLAGEAIAELNKAGSNLNQIARAVNMANWPEAAHMRAALDIVQRAALHILKAFAYKRHDEEG
jgi:hypothetical protein